jgi:hypothetical protein
VRDLFLFAVLLALVWVVPRRPFIGGLAWVVFGVMYPHRLTSGLGVPLSVLARHRAADVDRLC